MERDILMLFEYERRRRPALAALVAQVDVLTEAQISIAEVPLPWMREALLRLKAKRHDTVVQGIIEAAVVDGIIPDPIGTMRRWEGAETYIKIGRTALLMKPGTLVWLDASGMWIDTIHTTEIDDRLRPNTVVCGSITRSGYNLAVRERARGATLSEFSSYVEPASQVRFYRPG